MARCVGGEAPAAVAAAARGRGASLARFKWLNGVFHLCFDDRPGPGARVTGAGGRVGGQGPGAGAGGPPDHRAPLAGGPTCVAASLCLTHWPSPSSTTTGILLFQTVEPTVPGPRCEEDLGLPCSSPSCQGVSVPADHTSIPHPTSPLTPHPREEKGQRRITVPAAGAAGA